MGFRGQSPRRPSAEPWPCFDRTLRMTTPPLIPQANPGAGYRALKPKIDAAVARVLESGWYILGAEGRAFEAEFAAWLGTKAAVGCANGTDALALALRVARCRVGQQCRHRIAHGGRHRGRDRDDRRDAAADRYRSRHLHARSTGTRRGAAAPAAWTAADPRRHRRASVRAGGRSRRRWPPSAAGMAWR